MLNAAGPIAEQPPADGPSSPGLPPVVDDLSVYLVPGRVKSTAADAPGYFHIGQVYEDAADAERLGFRRAFLSERHGLKDAGVILGGVAARTTRLEVGSGAISAASRHPLVLAGFGATMQALNGPRMVMGLGRSTPLSLHHFGFEMFVEFATSLRRIWAGETVEPLAPGGSHLPPCRMDDQLEGVAAPQLWYFMLGGGPKAARASANPAWDGVALLPFLTPDAVAGAVQRIRTECERIDRDPASLRISHCLTTAPDLDDFETRAICHARLVTYLQTPGFGEALAKLNGWDESVIHALRNHHQLRGDELADQRFHRAELLGPAELIPDSWIEEVCGVGSTDDCVGTIATFREAGADETLLYGSSPAQNAGVIAGRRQAAA